MAGCSIARALEKLAACVEEPETVRERLWFYSFRRQSQQNFRACIPLIFNEVQLIHRALLKNCAIACYPTKWDIIVRSFRGSDERSILRRERMRCENPVTIRIWRRVSRVSIFAHAHFLPSRHAARQAQHLVKTFATGPVGARSACFRAGARGQQRSAALPMLDFGSPRKDPLKPHDGLEWGAQCAGR